MNPGIAQSKFLLDEDRERILAADSHVLVTGGPGSGKTTIALLKAEKRIKEGLAAGQSVLFLSFSRSAVGRILEASRIQLAKRLVWDAIYALQKAGLDKEAARLRRAIERG